MGPLHAFLLIIFDISGSYSENMEEKHHSFIQRTKLNREMQFGGDADIYMDKR